MKRKIALGLCVSMLTLSLVGCSSDKSTDKETSNTTETQQTEAFTGDKTVELPTGEGGKETLITTVTFEAGKPVNVNIDVKGEDGTMKSKLVEDGKYVMANETAPWTEQVDALEKFIVENDFDLSKVTLTDDEGKTDAVSGVTIKVGEYVEGVQKALDEVK